MLFVQVIINAQTHKKVTEPEPGLKKLKHKIVQCHNKTGIFLKKTIQCVDVGDYNT